MNNIWKSTAWLLCIACLWWVSLSGGCDPQSPTESATETVVKDGGNGTDATLTDTTPGDGTTGQESKSEPKPEPRPEPTKPEPTTPEPRPEPTLPDASPEPMTPEAGLEPYVYEKVAETIPEPVSTCGGLRQQYQDAVKQNQSCTKSSECQILQGNCSIGVGTCYHAANTNLTQKQLDDLVSKWKANLCQGPVCKCPPAPKSASCVSGVCQPDKALSCAEIKTRYDDLTKNATSCTEDADCKLLYGHCGTGLGGCYYYANGSLSQADLDALSKQWQSQGCSGPVCRCTAPPKALACKSGVCAPK